MFSDDDFCQETPWIAAPPEVRKGRGASSNITGRYELQHSEKIDDGWWQEEAPAALNTVVTPEQAKSIISYNQSPDIPFRASINPYRGCEHGCIYCFARPSHSYLGLSPGLDFETRLYAKTNAAELLRHELAADNYQPTPLALGVNTDAYQPCERQWQLTRQLLEVLLECRHPVGLITKSTLIERDIDLLQPLAEQQLAVATITLTTLDNRISRTLEPRAAAPGRRLQTIEKLARAGIPVTVSVAPVIPFITEQDMENILEAAAGAGACGAGYAILRLPWEVNPLFQQWLEAHFPERAGRVMSCVRQMHGGKDYRAEFGKRRWGEGVWAELIQRRFYKAVKAFGLDRQSHFQGIDTSRFRKPRHIPVAPENPKGQRDIFG